MFILWLFASKSDAKSTQGGWGDQQQFCPFKSAIMPCLPMAESLELGSLSAPFEPKTNSITLFSRGVLRKIKPKVPSQEQIYWLAVSQQMSLLQPQLPPREPCPGSVLVMSTAVQT